MAKSKKKSVKKKKPIKRTSKLKSSVPKKLDNFVVWFEIPVVDINRAMKFYSHVFGVKLEAGEMGDSKGAMFPFSPGAASGALIQSKENKPSPMGTMIYLSGGKDLSNPLKLVVPAGGKIIQEKLSIGDYGFMAIFEDTEGNHVALHSQS